MEKRWRRGWSVRSGSSDENGAGWVQRSSRGARGTSQSSVLIQPRTSYFSDIDGRTMYCGSGANGDALAAQACERFTCSHEKLEVPSYTVASRRGLPLADQAQV